MPRLLLVDDEFDYLDIVRLVLEEAGFEVDAVNDARHAVDVARQQPHDLALVDFMMPFVDGVETARALRDVPGWTAPIVLTTVIDDVAREHRSDFDDLLRKPFTIDQLLAVVRRNLPRDDDDGR